MSLTPDDIEGREFPVAADGYDRAEVDGFLVEVSAALRSARARLRAAEAASRWEAGSWEGDGVAGPPAGGASTDPGRHPSGRAEIRDGVD